jgi:hypothetical protein
MALMKQAVIPEFFARLKKAMPEPKTELEYDNVYHLLVSVVLSAQATDKGVNKATEKLYQSSSGGETGGGPQEPAGEPAGGRTTGPDGKAVDADFAVVE